MPRSGRSALHGLNPNSRRIVFASREAFLHIFESEEDSGIGLFNFCYAAL